MGNGTIIRRIKSYAVVSLLFVYGPRVFAGGLCNAPAQGDAYFAQRQLSTYSYQEIVNKYPKAFLTRKNTQSVIELAKYSYEDIVKRYTEAFVVSKKQKADFAESKVDSVAVENPAPHSGKTLHAQKPMPSYLVGETGKVIFTSVSDSDPSGESQKFSAPKKDWFKNLDIHGYVRTRHYFDIDRDYDEESTYECRNDVRLEKNLTFTPNITGTVSIDGRYHFLASESDSYETTEGFVRLWEGYISAKLGKSDTRIGQQIIRWGKSDEQNPTDVFTPEDFSEYLNFTSRADRKIPVLLLKQEYYLGQNNSDIFEGIWVPFFTPDRMAEAGRDYDPFVKRAYHATYGVAIDDKRPKKRIENSSFAGKWTHIGENADFSLSYSYHFNQTPSYHILPLEGKVEEKYFRQHTIGGDFETVIGKLGLRGEGAFTTNKLYVNIDSLDEDKVFKKNAFVGIIGGDYTFRHDIYVNLQYMSEFIFDYQDYTIEQEYSDSILWKLSKSFMRDKLKFETIGRWFFSRRDYYLTLRGSYDLTDALCFTLGMDVYDGDEDMSFGQADRADQIFTHLRYSF